jgi:hypothetical protein
MNTQSSSHFRFGIADPSTRLRTGFGLSKRDLEENAFISFFSGFQFKI